MVFQWPLNNLLRILYVIRANDVFTSISMILSYYKPGHLLKKCDPNLRIGHLHCFVIQVLVVLSFVIGYLFYHAYGVGCFCLDYRKGST